MEWPTHIIAAAGLVENENGEILMVKLIHRGWEYPGGIVEIGENLIDGVKREIKEESGIDVEVLKLICVNSNTQISKWHDGVTDVPTRINFHFICKPIGGEINTSEETSDVQWIAKDKVLEMVTTPFCRYTYQIFLDANEKVIYTEYEISPKFKVKARYEL